MATLATWVLLILVTLAIVGAGLVLLGLRIVGLALSDTHEPSS